MKNTSVCSEVHTIDNPRLILSSIRIGGLMLMRVSRLDKQREASLHSCGTDYSSQRDAVIAKYSSSLE